MATTGDKDKDKKPKDSGSANYTLTDDPKVVIGKKGAKITYDDFENANKNGFAWKDFPAFADYVGGWARPVTDLKEQPTPPPYFRAYGGQPNINSADVALLRARHQDDPKVMEILTRNIAPQGQIPMFSAQDADTIKALLAHEKVVAQTSNYDNAGLYNAMAKATGK